MFPYKVSYIQNPHVHIYGSAKKKTLHDVYREEVQTESINI